MNRLVYYSGITAVLFLCSCDKPNVLMSDRTRLEADIQKCHEELAAIDAKAMALGSDVLLASTNLEYQGTEWQRRVDYVEKMLASYSKKCTDTEAALKKLIPRVNSYKDKFGR